MRSDQRKGAESGASMRLPEENVIESEESDLSSELEQIDDETFNRVVMEANNYKFETPQEAHAYLTKKLKGEWSKRSLRKVVVPDPELDTKELTDPYYAALKREE